MSSRICLSLPSRPRAGVVNVHHHVQFFFSFYEGVGVQTQVLILVQ